MQNLYGGLILGGGTLNSELGNQIANTYNGLTGTVQSTAQAAAWQSMAAWMFYLNEQGLWEGDSGAVQNLANNIIQMATTYGVACCHHTCKNLDFNMKIIQASSLTPQQKAQYAKILSEATLTDPLYVDDSENGDGQSENSPSKVLVNGTTDDDSGDGSSNGATPVGENPQSAKTDSSQSGQSGSSSSDAGSDASKSKAYEINKSSPAKSASSDSSMPIVVIIAVIALIAIFLVGYLKNDDFDDY